MLLAAEGSCTKGAMPRLRFECVLVLVSLRVCLSPL